VFHFTFQSDLKRFTYSLRAPIIGPAMYGKICESDILYNTIVIFIVILGAVFKECKIKNF
jgi:hypothetical protein